NKDGKIQYVVLEGEPGHQDAIIRTENAVDTLKANGIELEKLECGIANWNRAQAQNRMMQMVSQYQNKIELVLANNDDMALGARDAYEKLNFTESALPVIFGIDGTDVGLLAVAEEKLSGTVYNDKEGQALAMAKLTIALVTGKGMEDIPFVNEKYVYLTYYKVTMDNIGDYLKQDEE
ncbi:MAG: substrate-binding domain-containing protein, partial [Lachnospiraceae bacterium]|nr:substrate-binding domain-containing protein [Lachnospiraceae bacterium]